MYTQELRDSFAPVVEGVTHALQSMTNEEIFERADFDIPSYTFTNSEQRASIGRYMELLEYPHDVIVQAANLYQEPGVFEDIYARFKSGESFREEPAKHVAILFFRCLPKRISAEWIQTNDGLNQAAKAIVKMSLELYWADFMEEKPEESVGNILFFESMKDTSFSVLPSFSEMREKYPIKRAERVCIEPFFIQGLKNPMVPRHAYAPIGEYGEQHARLLLQTARVCGETMYQKFREEFKDFDDEHEQLLKAVTFYGQESQYSLLKNVSSPMGLFSALEGIISIKDAFLLGTMLKLPDVSDAAEAIELLRSERFPTRFALAAPSLVVGPMAVQGLYISPMVEKKEDGLRLSAPFRSFLVDQKREQTQRILTPVSGIDAETGEFVRRHVLKPNERGFGCPVAHKTSDQKVPSLDALVDQFARVYQVLSAVSKVRK